MRIAPRRFVTPLSVARSISGFVGEASLTQGRKLLQLAAVATTVLLVSARPATWRRTIRRPLASQIVSSGVEAIGVTVFLAVSLGILLVAQYQLWLGNVVQSRWLGPIFIAVVVRELGPILVNLVVIARSGGTMAAELALVHVIGEDRVAEAQGLDPIGYFVVPRVVALMISVSCLTLLLNTCALLTVYIVGQWIGAKTGSLQEFTQSAISDLTLVDVIGLTLKGTVPPLLTGCICCIEGFGANDTTAEVPHAARVAVQRSVIALFTVIAFISIGAYL